MNSSTSTSGIQKDAGVCGGEARIRNTWHTVAGLVHRRRLGLPDASILQHHPDLTVADLEAAWSYFREHADEIDRFIRQDEES